MAIKFGALAEEAIEDGVNRAREAVKDVRRRAEAAFDDFSAEATYRVKRQPWAAIGVAACVGLLFGATVGWASGRMCRPRQIH
jgi:ElaB/YqjD/DUF883 family membrane-anchored ribosome-binding protein